MILHWFQKPLMQFNVIDVCILFVVAFAVTTASAFLLHRLTGR